jgi:glycosyltransferase involved in cell wall biosynthesis
VPDDDPVALSERLWALMNQSDVREKMSTNGIEHSRGYAWEKIAAQIQTLYHEILAEHKGSDHD